MKGILGFVFSSKTEAKYHGVERNYKEYIVSQPNIRQVTMSWWSCIRVKLIDIHSEKN